MRRTGRAEIWKTAQSGSLCRSQADQEISLVTLVVQRERNLIIHLTLLLVGPSVRCCFVRCPIRKTQIALKGHIAIFHIDLNDEVGILFLRFALLVQDSFSTSRQPVPVVVALWSFPGFLMYQPRAPQSCAPIIHLGTCNAHNAGFSPLDCQRVDHLIRRRMFKGPTDALFVCFSTTYHTWIHTHMACASKLRCKICSRRAPANAERGAWMFLISFATDAIGCCRGPDYGRRSDGCVA